MSAQSTIYRKSKMDKGDVLIPRSSLTKTAAVDYDDTVRTCEGTMFIDLSDFTAEDAIPLISDPKEIEKLKEQGETFASLFPRRPVCFIGPDDVSTLKPILMVWITAFKDAYNGKCNQLPTQFDMVQYHAKAHAKALGEQHDDLTAGTIPCVVTIDVMGTRYTAKVMSREFKGQPRNFPGFKSLGDTTSKSKASKSKAK